MQVLGNWVQDWHSLSFSVI